MQTVTINYTVYLIFEKRNIFYFYILQQFVHYNIEKIFVIVLIYVLYITFKLALSQAGAISTACLHPIDHDVSHGIAPSPPRTHPLCMVLQLSVPQFCLVPTISLK